MGCKCSETTKKVLVYSSGSIIAFLALIIGLLWPPLVHKIIFKELVLENGTISYNNWIETPIPMYLEIYLFNWTNPEDIRNLSIKPNFQEMGPYVFLEKHKRIALNWNNNSTITFNQTRTWHFEPTKSNGTLEDLITTANVMSATVAFMSRDKGELFKDIANVLILKNGGTFTTTKFVREWLFEGFEDPLLTFLRKIKNTLKINIPFDRFGWFVERNNSGWYDGQFVMNTGSDSIYKLGILTEWNGLNRTQFYNEHCAMVNGTTGELWPPSLIQNETKTIFATDICRSVTLDPYEDVEKRGVRGKKWIGTERVFDNGDKYPENKCFCEDENLENCPKSGVQDMSKCRYGAPVFVSYPHFYLANEEYVQNITGMNPDREKHEFSISLDNFAAIPLEVNARLQINMLLQPFKEFKCVH